MGARKNDLVSIAKRLGKEVDELQFRPPVTHVYNPLAYAWVPHRRYLMVHGTPPKEVLLVGMNPGPFGMAQSGVPFGDVSLVRDWLRIGGKVQAPAHEHPKRPIRGFECPRGEVSGRRLWGWARGRFVTPERFFRRFFVWNYCPLCFMEASGRNRTPDKLPAEERRALYAACDAALARAVEALQPRHVVGIGRFAAERARAVLARDGRAIGVAPHPSPASPAANRGWEAIFERALIDAGIRLA